MNAAKSSTARMAAKKIPSPRVEKRDMTLATNCTKNKSRGPSSHGFRLDYLLREVHDEYPPEALSVLR